MFLDLATSSQEIMGHKETSEITSQRYNQTSKVCGKLNRKNDSSLQQINDLKKEKKRRERKPLNN